MGIAYKLFSRMTDMAEDLALHSDASKERELVEFQDEIGWPFRASQSQIEDWNSRRWPGCDCQNPEPASGAALVSMECPAHNLYPSVQ